MPAQLSVHPAERASRRLVLDDGERVTIGRDPACEVVLDDPRVSKRHATLDWNGRTWCLLDLGSKNGTSVNGLSASGQELATGDWVSFGGVPGRFELLTEEEAQARRRSREARLETTVRLRQRIEQAAGPEEMLQRLLESAREVLGAERGFVVLTAADGALRVHAASGFEAAAGRAFTGSVGVVRRVAETGQGFVVSDLSADAVIGARPSVVAQGLASVACLPLRLQGRVAGFLYVDSRRAGSVVDDLDVQILEGLAEHACVALGAGEVHRRLQSLRAAAAGAAAALERQLQAVRVHVEPA